MSSSRFFSSIRAASGAFLLPTLCSAADTRGFAPLHPDTSQLCAPPEPVHSFRFQLYDVLRQRHLFSTILPLTAFKSP